MEANPALLTSFFPSSLVSPLPLKGYLEMVSTLVPQLLQKSESSSNLAPQFVQNSTIKTPP